MARAVTRNRHSATPRRRRSTSTTTTAYIARVAGRALCDRFASRSFARVAVGRRFSSRVTSGVRETAAMDEKSSCEGACSRDTPRLSESSIEEGLRQRPLWRRTADGRAISRAFTSKNWSAAMEFLNAVSVVAEREGHHPDVAIKNYRDVEVVIATHAIGGLSRFDFILAAKIDAECAATYSPKWARENGLA